MRDINGTCLHDGSTVHSEDTKIRFCEDRRRLQPMDMTEATCFECGNFFNPEVKLTPNELRVLTAIVKDPDTPLGGRGAGLACGIDPHKAQAWGQKALKGLFFKRLVRYDLPSAGYRLNPAGKEFMERMK